ncbi:hypothetical protein SAMN05444417_1023 [Wenxinia saemankumensis]|uniref:ATP-dependent endonuclease of the OLD family n=2 Tax=Wenxinia saemankumensis TaxID=1447782 RepID=A0A1M6C5M3_9RHOB|nr:hypothetical protein SAMN05444417_1023 [Wenxinia saemankumensis]
MDGRLLLVEGESDAVALRTLAEVAGGDLAGTGIVVAGGAHATPPILLAHGPRGSGRLVGGLIDRAEVPFLIVALRRAGFPCIPPETAPARAGFGICDRDLEDELLRALGEDAALDLIAREGEASALATLRSQSAWADRPLHDQLRRFLASRAGRKRRYAGLMVRAIPAGRHPAPLRHALGLV